MAELSLTQESDAFYYVALPLLLEVQEDEVELSITDNNFQQAVGRQRGHDRGIDAVFLENTQRGTCVHIFTCKYKRDFDRTESFFPAGEIDSITSFMTDLLAEDREALRDVNPRMKDKLAEIWSEMRRSNPEFVIHICSNLTDGLEPEQQERLALVLNRFRNIRVETHTQFTLGEALSQRHRVEINGKVRVIDKSYFKPSAGAVQSIIAEIEAAQLLRLLCADASLRENVDADDQQIQSIRQLEEQAFEDNIRVYLTLRSRVNQDILDTALSEENNLFFYFNNGITMTCSDLDYPERRNPIVALKNFQVVNGGQTIHALFDAFRRADSDLSEITLLCRIYKASHLELASKIAARTNSQSPVSSRDIRSNDKVLVKLAAEFDALGYKFERKRNQFPDAPRDRRIDAERAGQVCLAFYEEMPVEAKNRKRLIFGEKYEALFNENTTAREVLVALDLFNLIEAKRHDLEQSEPWLSYASYHLLFALKLVADLKNIPTDTAHKSDLEGLYPDAKNAVLKAIEAAQADETEEFVEALFFKTKKAKTLIDFAVEAMRPRSPRRRTRTRR